MALPTRGQKSFVFKIQPFAFAKFDLGHAVNLKLYDTQQRFVGTVLLDGDEKLHSSSSITVRITCGSSGKITSCRSKACREGLAAEATKKVKVWFQGALDP